MHCNGELFPPDDFDEWRVLVKRELPRPVRHLTNAHGVTWLIGGETDRVLIRASRRSTTVYALGCRRTEDGRCQRRAMRVGAVLWSDLPAESALAVTVTLITTAVELGFDDLPANSNVPAAILEQMVDRDACEACVEAEAVTACELAPPTRNSIARPAARVRGLRAASHGAPGVRLYRAASGG